MHQQMKQQWTLALRSGEYQQGQGNLHEGDTFCVLGVLCDLHREVSGEPWLPIADATYSTYLDCEAMLPREVREWSGLRGEDEIKLSGSNDLGWSFVDLADWIERFCEGKTWSTTAP